MRFARMDGGTVAEIITLPDGVDPSDAFHADIAATLKKCADDVEPGWRLSGSNYHPPETVEPSLDGIKTSRIVLLRQACEASITSGFLSSALGSVHTYPSDMKAQINLMASVTDSLMPGLPSGWQSPFWVCDAEGVWSYKMHTASQIQQAGRDGKANVITCQAALDKLIPQVLAAKTPEAVEAVVWPEGSTA